VLTCPRYALRSDLLPAAPTNQIASYYRFGIADWCPDYLNKWTTCLRLKTKMPEEAAAVRRQALERERIGHMWDFKPPYAQEAVEMYGSTVSARESSEGDSSSTRTSV
jgi:hypothetical protein